LTRHSVRCCCDRIEASKTMVPKVAFGSFSTELAKLASGPTSALP
jgi:hypothetical protein